jgi:hypothetical protein
MAIHYSSAKYAASMWGAASALTDQLSWEAISQEVLDIRPRHMGWPKLNVCCARTGNPFKGLIAEVPRCQETLQTVAAVRELSREGQKGSRGCTPALQKLGHGCQEYIVTFSGLSQRTAIMSLCMDS